MAATGCVIRNVKVAVVNYLPQQHVLELLVRPNQTSAPVIDDKKSTQEEYHMHLLFITTQTV